MGRSCAQCGSPVRDVGAFCHKCGAPLPASPAGAPAEGATSAATQAPRAAAECPAASETAPEASSASSSEPGVRPASSAAPPLPPAPSGEPIGAAVATPRPRRRRTLVTVAVVLAALAAAAVIFDLVDDGDRVEGVYRLSEGGSPMLQSYTFTVDNDHFSLSRDAGSVAVEGTYMTTGGSVVFMSDGTDWMQTAKRGRNKLTFTNGEVWTKQ